VTLSSCTLPPMRSSPSTMPARFTKPPSTPRLPRPRRCRPPPEPDQLGGVCRPHHRRLGITPGVGVPVASPTANPPARHSLPAGGSTSILHSRFPPLFPRESA
jgi:hypothetical protein